MWSDEDCLDPLWRPPGPLLTEHPEEFLKSCKQWNLAEYVVERELASAPRQWRNGAEVGEFENTAYL